MLTPIDVLCLVMMAGLIALEGSRGIIPSLVDFLAVLGTALAARFGHIPLLEYIQRPSMAYLLVVGVLLVLTISLSIYMSTRLKVNVTSLEAAVGAVFGALTGLILTYMMLEWVSIYYGPHSAILRDSVLATQLHDFAGLHSLMEFIQTLRGK